MRPSAPNLQKDGWIDTNTSFVAVIVFGIVSLIEAVLLLVKYVICRDGRNYACGGVLRYLPFCPMYKAITRVGEQGSYGCESSVQCAPGLGCVNGGCNAPGRIDPRLSQALFRDVEDNASYCSTTKDCGGGGACLQGRCRAYGQFTENPAGCIEGLCTGLFMADDFYLENLRLGKVPPRFVINTGLGNVQAVNYLGIGDTSGISSYSAYSSLLGYNWLNKPNRVSSEAQGNAKRLGIGILACLVSVIAALGVSLTKDTPNRVCILILIIAQVVVISSLVVPWDRTKPYGLGSYANTSY